MLEDSISPLERQLYFKTAHAHFKAGCPALALEVLSKLPSKIMDPSTEQSNSKCIFMKLLLYLIFISICYIYLLYFSLYFYLSFTHNSFLHDISNFFCFIFSWINPPYSL
jgi:hypothetical protein